MQEATYHREATNQVCEVDSLAMLSQAIVQGRAYYRAMIELGFTIEQISSGKID
jgi:hypothetical protein